MNFRTKAIESVVQEFIGDIEPKELEFSQLKTEERKQLVEEASLILGTELFKRVLSHHTKEYEQAIMRDENRSDNVAKIIALKALNETLKGLAKPTNK